MASCESTTTLVRGSRRRIVMTQEGPGERSSEACSSAPCSAEVCSFENCSFEACPFEACLFEACSCEHCSVEVSPQEERSFAAEALSFACHDLLEFEVASSENVIAACADVV